MPFKEGRLDSRDGEHFPNQTGNSQFTKPIKAEKTKQKNNKMTVRERRRKVPTENILFRLGKGHSSGRLFQRLAIPPFQVLL